MEMQPTGDRWRALTANELPIGDIYQWAVRPDCGAVVLFSGTVRDHADGRDDVSSLDYEAYAEAVIPAFDKIIDEVHQRFPNVKRVAILHRTGRILLSESSVVVAVSSAHRPTAFEAARFAIDALKESVPIWKKENWSDGSDWGTDPHEIISPKNVAGHSS